jgi:hypothetical protein
MAADGPRPGYRALTDAEKLVQAAQGQALVGDLKAVVRVNPTQPFTTLKDAVTNLLPFHVGTAG